MDADPLERGGARTCDFAYKDSSWLENRGARQSRSVAIVISLSRIRPIPTCHKGTLGNFTRGRFGHRDRVFALLHQRPDQHENYLHVSNAAEQIALDRM